MIEEKWLSVHIFYSSNQNPIIVDCIGPMVDTLREQGYIRRYFFIKYWMEGPHVRLRLLPAQGVSHEKLKALIEPRIEKFLQERPALYELEQERYGAFHKQMFLAEYGEEAWNEKYGADGVMPFRDNNSYHYIEYEPEYDRYGGPHGVELAEWHFEKSSDIILRILRDINVRVRDILLGISIQLSLPVCYGFMEQDQQVLDFLDNYLKYWTGEFFPISERMEIEFQKKYAKMAKELQARIADVRQYMIDGTVGNLTPMEQEWAAHIRQLRQRIDDLVRRGLLIFRGKGEDGGLGQITMEDVAYYQILLSSYIHMTNNRLGVSISDEVYLAYILKLALLELMGASMEAV